METTFVNTLRKDVTDIMDGVKVPAWIRSFCAVNLPSDVPSPNSAYGVLPKTDKSFDFKTDPVCAFGRMAIDAAFPPEPTDVVTPYDPEHISNWLLRAATFGMEFTKEREWQKHTTKKSIIDTKYNAYPEPWIVQTTHPFDLVYMWFTRHAYRDGETFPTELADALGESPNLMRRITAAQVLIHECDRRIRNPHFTYSYSYLM